MSNGLITGITAITALIATVINLIAHLGSIKKSEEAKREDDYYHKVLRPYIKKVHEMPNNRSIDLFTEIDINEPFIPPYIRYVYYNENDEKKRNEQLNKMLIIDYIKMYENEDRAISRFFKVADRVEKLFMLLLSAVGFTTFTGLGICFLAFALPQADTWKNYQWIGIVIFELILASFAVGCMFVLLYYAKLDKDMYSTRKNKIDKQLKNLDADFIRITGNNYY